jgi:hypothetical protein
LSDIDSQLGVIRTPLARQIAAQSHFPIPPAPICDPLPLHYRKLHMWALATPLDWCPSSSTNNLLAAFLRHAQPCPSVRRQVDFANARNPNTSDRLGKSSGEQEARITHSHLAAPGPNSHRSPGHHETCASAWLVVLAVLPRSLGISSTSLRLASPDTGSKHVLNGVQNALPLVLTSLISSFRACDSSPIASRRATRSGLQALHVEVVIAYYFLAPLLRLMCRVFSLLFMRRSLAVITGSPTFDHASG